VYLQLYKRLMKNVIAERARLQALMARTAKEWLLALMGHHQ
jgi:hypothetical protein